MNAQLHVVTDVPLRAIGLIRVSNEREGMVSPELQRMAIEEYARTRGYRIVDWLEGLDESGSRLRSPWWKKLDEGIGHVEEGRADVLLVWKFSRSARHRLKWAVALDKVENAGGLLESATEQVDTTTSTGRFARGMLGELNAFEAERIGDGWKEAHARRVANGLPATGKPKWGYVYDRQAKLHRPDPVTGPVLATVYQSYVAGTSVYALVQWLNREGHLTVAGGKWTDRTLRRVLDSGFAAGWFLAGGNPKKKIPPTLHRGVHEPLIDEATWQAYLDARGIRRSRPVRTERSRYVFSGMIVHDCGHRMTAGMFGRRRVPKFRCANGRATAGTDCPGGYVMLGVLEDAVLEWLAEHADDVEAAEAVAEAQVAQADASQAAERRKVAEITRIEQALVRLTQRYSEDKIDDDSYQAARADYLTRKQELAEAVEESARRRRTVDVNAGRVARSLMDDWDEITVEGRREMLHKLIDRIEVSTGRPRSQVRVVPTWADG